MIIKLATGLFAFCLLIAKSFFMTSVNFQFHRWIWLFATTFADLYSHLKLMYNVHNIEVVNGVNIFHFYLCTAGVSQFFTLLPFRFSPRATWKLVIIRPLGQRFQVPHGKKHAIDSANNESSTNSLKCQICLAMNFTWFVPSRILLLHLIPFFLYAQ